jgi:metal-responsive CopG/Arc/MetJ family transcriptional regulator
MRKIGKKFSVILPIDLLEKVDTQAAKEGRQRNEFIRRVLDRYLLEVEFRGDLAPEAEESIKKNKELLRLLKDA